MPRHAALFRDAIILPLMLISPFDAAFLLRAPPAALATLPCLLYCRACHDDAYAPLLLIFSSLLHAA